MIFTLNPSSPNPSILFSRPISFLPISLGFGPQIREQMSVPDLYVVTVAFLALKKTGFSKIKIFSKIFFEKF